MPSKSNKTLARNLIGTAARLPQLNPPERFSGNPRQLFDDYCSRCNPPLDAREADQIWRSAEKDNPTPTLPDGALQNNGNHWRRRNGQVIGGTGNGGNVLAMPPTATALTLNERIKEILERGLKSSEEKAKFIFIAIVYTLVISSSCK